MLDIGINYERVRGISASSAVSGTLTDSERMYPTDSMRLAEIGLVFVGDGTPRN